MLYERNLPEDLTKKSDAANDGTSTAPRAERYPLNNEFDELHSAVYDVVQPQTHEERLFLTRCLFTVLEGGKEWTPDETTRVFKALSEARNGFKVMFENVELSKTGLPDYQVA